MLRKLAVAGACLAAVATLEVAPAYAFGERMAYRSCGSNWIESWPGNTNTIRVSGSCSGTLGAGARLANGSWTPVVWGDRYAARVRWYGFDMIGGHHWGCKSGCSASVT